MTVSIPEPALPQRRQGGQATQVEQSRAVAEVQAAVIVAQQCPRNVQLAIDEMLQSCNRPALADRAFYSYPRSGQNVTGVSVYLARELARCWGNIQYGQSELERTDENGTSEILVWAWDVQTNARAQQSIIVPHARDTKKGRVQLEELRDIYENNANQGARRLREAILAILPQWFVEEAKEACWKTLKSGGGKALPLRITDAVEHFRDTHSVSQGQLERRIGRPRAQRTDLDVAQLTVINTSITRGETTKDDVFPDEVITIDEIKPIEATVVAHAVPNTEAKKEEKK